MLREIQRVLDGALIRDKETQMSEFVHLVEKPIYSAESSPMNYLQQKMAHDLSITFPGISCVHQHTGVFNSECGSCRQR